MLALVGLVSPMIVAFLLLNRNPDLRRDFYRRFFNFRDINPWYIFLTCFIMLASILVAMGISVLFGYSPGQFVITGHFSFTSGVLPVWFLLIIAPVLEELAWHSYGTDCLRNKFSLFYTSLIFGAYWAIWHVRCQRLGITTRRTLSSLVGFIAWTSWSVSSHMSWSWTGYIIRPEGIFCFRSFST